MTSPDAAGTGRPALLAYYFPGFHHDPVLYPGLPEGWSEWELVRRARPFFPGHRQPRRPLWGFEDDDSPAALARKLAVAGEHHIEGMVVICYAYQDAQPGLRVLEAALEAVTPGSARPAMMWANHRRYWCYPEPEDTPGEVYLTIDYSEDALLGLIARWAPLFAHPNYYRLPSGEPLFSLYSPQAMVDAVGPEALRWFLDRLRAAAVGQGLPGLHVHACSVGYLKDLDVLRDGFDSCSDYLALGYTENRPGREPQFDLPSLYGRQTVPIDPVTRLTTVAESMRRMAGRTPIPYLPSATVGRDCSPRVRAPGVTRVGHYSARPILLEEIPELAPAAVRLGLRHLAAVRPRHPLLFINAWNEWTEGAYLEPDTVNGLTALEAVAREWEAA